MATDLSSLFLFCNVRILIAVSQGQEGAWRMAGAALVGHPMGSVAEAAGNSLSAQYPAN